MSPIRGGDTQPELVVRKGMHARGFRYWPHNPRLPGRLDLASQKFHAVVKVNGRYWYEHRYYQYRHSATRHDFWSQKIDSNRQRDRRNLQLLVRPDGA